LSEQKFFRREEIIGKSVVNMNAEKIGEVKDIGYDTNGKMALVISSPQGEEKFYSMDETVAIRDVVLIDENKLTPKTTAAKTSPTTFPAFISTNAPRAQNMPPQVAYTPPPFGGGDMAQTQIPTVAMKTCQYCGRESRAQSKFCVHCGKSF
jgi:sporulation protein YlmC with PRC-barrel domain